MWQLYLSTVSHCTLQFPLLSAYGSWGPTAWLIGDAFMMGHPLTTLCACRVLSYLDKWGHSNKALRAFEWMQLHTGKQHAFDTQDTFLYTRLMTMFTRRSSDCSQALHIFDSMQSRGIKPDLVAYNTAINAAGKPFSTYFAKPSVLCKYIVIHLSISSSGYALSALAHPTITFMAA